MSGFRWLFLSSLLVITGSSCNDDRPPKKPLDASNRDVPQGGFGGGGTDARDGSGDQARDGSDSGGDGRGDGAPADAVDSGGDVTVDQAPADTSPTEDAGPG